MLEREPYMSSNRSQSCLKLVLDEIWHSTGDRVEAAKHLSEKLTSQDWALLGAWDIAASWKLGSHEIDLSEDGQFRFVTASGDTILSARVASRTALPGEAVAVEFAGNIKYVLVDRDPSIAIKRIERDSIETLLVALEIARDHLNSIVLLPREMRGRKLESIAQDLQIDVLKLRALFSNVKLLEPYI
jgi:hypothetical protein